MRRAVVKFGACLLTGVALTVAVGWAGVAWLGVGGGPIGRVEDTILITPNGAEILTGAVPKEVDELLALMAPTR